MRIALVTLFKIGQGGPAHFPWLRRRSLRAACRHTASAVGPWGATLKKKLAGQTDSHRLQAFDETFEWTRALDWKNRMGRLPPLGFL
eukprot:410740-Pyramimonas_sp.AAC.1